MRVLVFGSSIACGHWDTEGGWPGRLRANYVRQHNSGIDNDPPSVYNLGVSGDSSDDVLARIENETKARKRPSNELVFIIAIGTNDSRLNGEDEHSTPEKYRNNLSSILSIARKYSNKILFIGLTPCVEARTNPVSWVDVSYINTRLKEFDLVLQEFCLENGVRYVKLFDAFSKAQAKAELLPDGLHPNNEGHKLMADIILKALQNLLNEKVDNNES